MEKEQVLGFNVSTYNSQELLENIEGYEVYYYLNQRSFSNSLDLRNKYLHGNKLKYNDEDTHYKNYMVFVKIIILIKIKIVNKYEDFITILLSQFYGKEARNQMCQKYVSEYISKIEKIVDDWMKVNQIKKGNANVIASEIYALIASTIVYKMKSQENIDVLKLYKQFENTIIEGIREKNN